MDQKMERKFGVYVFLGGLIGAIFGWGLGMANGNSIAGLGGGALAGVFIGWFIAAAVFEKQKGQKDK
jgi:uncharacterized protein YcfJ